MKSIIAVRSERSYPYHRISGSRPPSPIRWTTVATYWSPAEAHIARLKLESEEIDCLIVDENVVATQWLWANALGGVKLQVPESEAARARELLAGHATDVSPALSGEPLFDGLERCPQCGSDDVHVERFSRKFAFLSILLLGLPLPFFHRAKRCEKCGFGWNADSTKSQ